MSKKRARLRFAWLAIVAAIALFFAVIPFAIPFTSDNYNSFAGAIDVGLDLTGGEAVILNCKSKDVNVDVSDAIDKSLNKIQDAVKSAKFGEYVIRKQGDQIRIELKEADESFFKWLSTPHQVFVTLNEVEDPTKLPEVYLTSQHIKTASATYRLKEGTTDEAEYGINLKFTDEGMSILNQIAPQASKNEAQSLYVYFDQVSSDNLFGTIECKKSKLSNNVFLVSEKISSDYAAAVENAYEILSSTFDVKLEYVDTYAFSAVLGSHTPLLLGIAAAVTILAIMIFFWVRYGDFGLLADFSFVFFAVLMLFFLQAIPLIKLTLSSIISIMLCVLMFAYSCILIFERIKQEYAMGKKVPLAVKSGFKRAFWPIFDSHLVVGVISLILYFVGSSSIKYFAFPLFVGALVSIFVSMVITRFVVKSYLPLNSTKIKKLRLHREKGVVEIKEEEEKPAQEVNLNTAPEKTGGEN